MYEERGMPDSLIIASITFIVFLFTVIITWYMLSPFYNAIFDSFLAADLGEATDEAQRIIPYVRSCLEIARACVFATPFAVFVFWIFHREPSRYRGR